MTTKNKKIHLMTKQELVEKLAEYKKRGDFNSRYYINLKTEYQKRTQKKRA